MVVTPNENSLARRDETRPAPARRLSHVVTFLVGHPFVVLLCLLAAVIGAYLPALDAQFVWDDNMLVRGNLMIRSPLFILEVFRHTLFSDESNFYRPTQTLIFIADYWAWGMQAFGYHLTSILIHALNGFGLFLLLRRLLPSLLPGAVSERESPADWQPTDLMAWVLAFLWALYPVHSAAVAYVSGSADSLAMLFCLLAWLAAGHGLRAETLRARAGYGLAAAVSFLFGLCSKEIAFVWLTLFALHLFFFAPPDTVALRRKLALIAGSLLVLSVYLFLRHLPDPVRMPPNQPQFSRGIMALRALGDYGSLLLFPGKLLMERQVYPAPGAVLSAEDDIFYTSLTVGGVLVLALFALGAAWRGSGQRLRVFGVCWFACGFLPVSNLFVTINASVAEHWLYLPSIGFLLFVAGCVWQVPTRRLRVAAVAFAMIVATAFGVRTYWRAFDWADEMTFFRQTVLNGGDVPRARLSLANAFSHRQQDAAAIVLLRKVAVECPDNLTVQVNLANALARQGHRDEARPILERAFLRAGTLEPKSLLIILGDLEVLESDRPNWPALKAAALEKAWRTHPDSWDLVQYTARNDARASLPAGSTEMVARYTRAHWWHYPSWYLLGCEYARTGHPGQAVATLKQASRLDVHDAEALSMAAEVCAGENHLEEAAALQREAVSRQPDSPRQRMLLSQILASLSQPTESARQLTIATALLRSSGPTAP